MILKNHLATPFLSSSKVAMDIIKNKYPNDWECLNEPETILGLEGQIHGMWRLLSPNNQKAYYVTNTVIDKLDLLKVDKRNEKYYDWTIFSDVKEGKRTYIFDENKVLRIRVGDNKIHVCMIYYSMINKVQGHMKYDMFWVDTETNRHPELMEIESIQKIETFIYKLLCFVFLSDIDEDVVLSGRKSGTKKSGKIINTLPVPVTIINSRWNTTVTVNGFVVRGHGRMQACGEEMKKRKLIWIEPFVKDGRTIKAKSLTQ
jgi:hypothetical protein